MVVALPDFDKAGASWGKEMTNLLDVPIECFHCSKDEIAVSSVKAWTCDDHQFGHSLFCNLPRVLAGIFKIHLLHRTIHQENHEIDESEHRQGDNWRDHWKPKRGTMHESTVHITVIASFSHLTCKSKQGIGHSMHGHIQVVLLKTGRISIWSTEFVN